MYSKINLMVPTYRRVAGGKFPRFLKSCIDRATNLDNICLTILCNHDDYETLGFLNNYNIKCEFQIMTTFEPRPHLGKFFNQMYYGSRFQNPDTLVSMCGDDMYWETNGYDEQILNIANRDQGKSIVYCNDNFSWGNKLCVNMFVSRKYVRATGKKFMCELFPIDFIDVIWMRVGQITNSLFLLNDVVLKHDHSTAEIDKNWDHTFRRMRGQWPDAVRNRDVIPGYCDEIVRNLMAEGFFDSGEAN